jgi:hypothetical protein
VRYSRAAAQPYAVASPAGGSDVFETTFAVGGTLAGAGAGAGAAAGGATAALAPFPVPALDAGPVNVLAFGSSGAQATALGDENAAAMGHPDRSEPPEPPEPPGEPPP